MTVGRQLVELELQRLEDAGRLTAKEVVNAARDVDSIMHDEFEWDDSIAGEQHRLMQARTLIRTVKLEVRVEQSILRVPQYVHNPMLPPHEQGYTHVLKLRTQEELAEAAMQSEYDRVKYHVNRMREVALGVGKGDTVDERLRGLLEQ